MDLRELRVMVRIVDRLAKRALFAEEQMVALKKERDDLLLDLIKTEQSSTASIDLVTERDALRAQLDTERHQHTETANLLAAANKKVREWIAENKRLQTESAERGVEIASLQVRLRQSIARGETAACDPPEATHITPDGKATAQAAVTPQPGDVVRLVRVPTQEEYPDWDDAFGVVGSEGIVRSASPQCANVYYSGVIWVWPLSCVEVVTKAVYGIEGVKTVTTERDR